MIKIYITETCNSQTKSGEFIALIESETHSEILS